MYELYIVYSFFIYTQEVMQCGDIYFMSNAVGFLRAGFMSFLSLCTCIQAPCPAQSHCTAQLMLNEQINVIWKKKLVL